MTKKNKLIEKRREWLKRNYGTIRDFSDTVFVDYNTASRWFREGRPPRRMGRSLILSKHQDFPFSLDGR